MTDERMERLGEAVRERRAQLGWTQTQVQRRGGPSVVVQSRVENGDSRGGGLSGRTLTAFDHGLRWQLGSARRVYDHGSEPAIRVNDEDIFPGTIYDRMYLETDFRRAILRLNELMPEDLDAVNAVMTCLLHHMDVLDPSEYD